MKATLRIGACFMAIEASDNDGLCQKKDALVELLDEMGISMIDVTFGSITDDDGEVPVPDYFGLFTQAGNELLIVPAKELLSKLRETPNEWVKHFLCFFKEYTRLDDLYDHGSEHGEMGDTAVREAVWLFGCKVADNRNITRKEIQKLWDQRTE